MTIIELKDQIVKRKLSNFYIFTGYEIGIINIYLQQMSNALKLPITRADSVASIFRRCQGGSLFGDDTGFYVIREDHDIMKQEQLFDTIKKDIGNNTIVLLYEKLDSRLKFGKHFKDDTVAFEKLTPNVLKMYVLKELNLSDANLDILITLCGGSYDMCMLEIDKVKQYMQKKDMNCDEAFSDLLRTGAIYQPIESSVFDFTDAVCSRQKHRAFDLERRLREDGISSVSILGTLYNSMKCVMLIACCDKNDNISEVTGLDNKQIYFNKKYVNKFDIGDLVFSVKLISKVISGIKSGWIDDVYATRYVLSQII